MGAFTLMSTVTGYLIKRAYERIEDRLNSVEDAVFDLHKNQTRDFGIIRTELKWLMKYVDDKK